MSIVRRRITNIIILDLGSANTIKDNRGALLGFIYLMALAIHISLARTLRYKDGYVPCL